MKITLTIILIALLLLPVLIGLHFSTKYPAYKKICTSSNVYLTILILVILRGFIFMNSGELSGVVLIARSIGMIIHPAIAAAIGYSIYNAYKKEKHNLRKNFAVGFLPAIISLFIFDVLINLFLMS